MRITRARKEWAEVIASLIMKAMNHECCKWFAGPNHTLDDFHNLMTRLVGMEDSQYSYMNTLVAVTDDESVAGICTSYDGSRLRELRKAFVNGALEAFGIDYSNMEDETQSGELYIDSLCVAEEYRNKGIAKMLINATIDKARDMEIPLVGLLVDKNNPKAEKLYASVGFHYANDSEWGGHEMRHLICRSYPTLPSQEG